MKYIKIKNKGDMVLALQNLILLHSNSSLISLEIHRQCKKFVNELEKILLSDELQDNSKDHG